MPSSTFICPEGHESTDPNDCSVCGSPIEASADSHTDDGAQIAAENAPVVPVTGDGPCRFCGAPRENATDECCPNCGADYNSGDLDVPAAVQPQPVASRTVPVLPIAVASAPVKSPAAQNGPRLVAVVSVDLGPRERTDGAVAPADTSERIFELVGDSMSLGRSRSADICLREDSAASNRHGEFVRLSDGSWAIRDGVLEPGHHKPSTNGTMLNGKAVAGSEVRRLNAGDVIVLGDWTVITISEL